MNNSFPLAAPLCYYTNLIHLRGLIKIKGFACVAAISNRRGKSCLHLIVGTVTTHDFETVYYT
jgi:hypothetical protein